MAENAVDFLLENLEVVMNFRGTSRGFSRAQKRQIQCLTKELGALRIFLNDSETSRYEHREVADLVAQIRDVAHEASDIIDAQLAGEIARRNRSKKISPFSTRYDMVREMLREIESIKEKMKEIRGNNLYPLEVGYHASSSSVASTSQVVDVVQENQDWKQLIKYAKTCPKFDLNGLRKTSLSTELGSIRNILKDLEENRCQHEEVKRLKEQIRRVASSVADILGMAEKMDQFQTPSSLLPKVLAMIKSHRSLGDVLAEIKRIKEEVNKIYKHQLYGIGVLQVGLAYCGRSSTAIPSNVDEENVVGLQQEVETFIDQLTAGVRKNLKVISIVGMAGLGKTTLARKLYNHPSILHYFYIRGWAYVSQVYQRNDLLLRLLSSVVQHKEEIYSIRDEKLGEELYKRLKGNRYLIVFDDIWNIDAWNDLKTYFPNDNVGSRIIFTTRITDVAMHAQPDNPPHHLRFLNEDESWNLFQQKVFPRASCRPDLMEIGKHIAKKCQGLPLAIVVVAGLLANTDKNEDSWRKVADSLSSYIVGDQEQCMDILTLSYNNLPNHLKLCFLYLGAFPEDYEIPVRKLIWLWIAEGFIRRSVGKWLEDVAEGYLKDLIDRNLVLVAKTKSTGGIRACRLHDLLHDLCLRKAKEEKFIKQLNEYREASSSIYSNCCLNPIGEKQRCLCVHSHAFSCISSELSAPYVRSFLCFASEQSASPPVNMSFNFQAFKLLRVLDLSAINISCFPKPILELVLLRYLALKGKQLDLPCSIDNLWNLETLIVSQGTGISIPPIICMMSKLRHLYLAGENHFKANMPDEMFNLQTLSQVAPSSCCWHALRKTPNLRKLGLCGQFLSHNGLLDIPVLEEYVRHLETLKLLNRGVPGRSHKLSSFLPQSLKRLTLSNTALEWEQMSVLARLPNLEALKLEFLACVGPMWETSDGGFPQLKFLRFYYMNMEKWNTSSSHFPRLERLVLHRCRKLEAIPSELGDISTLQVIEVSGCSNSVVNSARQIQEEQLNMGNDLLKILIINPPDLELPSFS